MRRQEGGRGLRKGSGGRKLAPRGTLNLFLKKAGGRIIEKET